MQWNLTFQHIERHEIDKGCTARGTDPAPSPNILYSCILYKHALRLNLFHIFNHLIPCLWQAKGEFCAWCILSPPSCDCFLFNDLQQEFFVHNQLSGHASSLVAVQYE